MTSLRIPEENEKPYYASDAPLSTGKILFSIEKNEG